MKKIRYFLLVLIIMVVVSVICLCVVSALAYTYKWQADKALIGVTFTYIVTGFVGGFSQKIMNKEAQSIGRKMLEGMILSLLFMGGLIVLSFFLIQNPLEITSRFWMIMMLLMGSACLGRIL